MASNKDPFNFDDMLAQQGMGSLVKQPMAQAKAGTTPPKPATSTSQTRVMAGSSYGAPQTPGSRPMSTTPGPALGSRTSSGSSLAPNDDPFASLMGGSKPAQPMSSR